MSRKYDRRSLPPLGSILKDFSGFSREENKLSRVGEVLRGIVAELRESESRPFYSMREMAVALSVPLRTIAIGYKKLEADGILVMLRGSHTVLVGRKHASKTNVSIVVGIPVWIYGFRHYANLRAFMRDLGDELWKDSVILDHVFYWEVEDVDPDFTDRLSRHHFDSCIWYQPFPHNRDSIYTMKDHGVRTLVISDSELHAVPSHVELDWSDAYQSVLLHWKTKYDVRSVILVCGRSSTMARVALFENLAGKAGMDCERKPLTPTLLDEMTKRGHLSPKTAFAILDEVVAVDFSLRNPRAFLHLAARHRILFGRDLPSVAFAPGSGLKVENLYAPRDNLVQGCVDTIKKWIAGKFETPKIVVKGKPAFDVEMRD